MSTDDHHEHSELSETQLRVCALETVLTEKGYVDPDVLDPIVEHYETKTGPHIGARVIARAWVDSESKAALLADAPRSERVRQSPNRNSITFSHSLGQ